VSTYGQTLDSQLEQLRAVGCSSRNIYREKVTGARADRRELLRMLQALAPGDVVTVTRIDRLARSTFDLFAIVKDRRCRRTIPLIGGTMGRHRHQHRAVDDCRSRRAGGRGARSNPHPHRRRQEPRQGPRAAYGPTRCPQHRSSGKRPARSGRKGLCSRNWPTPIMSGGRRFHDWEWPPIS
jgi:hypothetical protein